MNPALNRVASEARAADMRRRAGRDAIVLATIPAAGRAAKRESASPWTSVIAAILRLLQPRRTRPTLLVLSPQTSIRYVLGQGLLRR